MKFRLPAVRKHAMLQGTVCNVALRILPKPNTTDTTRLLPPLEKLEELRATLEHEFREGLIGVLGPTFRIHNFIFREATVEILLVIQTTRYIVRDYRALTHALRKLVLYFCDLLIWHLDEQAGRFQAVGKWVAAPSMIRVQLNKSSRGKSILNRLQQPLSLLLIATLLGSVLIPYFNDASNRSKLRHEERVKLAISILDQTKETDVRMDDMIRHFALFRQEHRDPRTKQEDLKTDQRAELKAFKELFYSYSSQAWWWPWNVWHKANLAALATPSESQKLANIREEYLKALTEGSQSFGILWERLLEKPYRPDDSEIDQLLSSVEKEVRNGRERHDQLALKMAQIFAGTE